MSSVKDYIKNRLYDETQDDDEEDDLTPDDSIARPGFQEMDQEPASPAQPSQQVPTQDPMAEYNKQAQQVSAIRNEALDKNSDINIYRALGQLAGAGAKAPIQSGIYDSLIKQNDERAKLAQDDLGKRASVMRYIQGNKAKQDAASLSRSERDKSNKEKMDFQKTRFEEDQRHNKKMEDIAGNKEKPEPELKDAQVQSATFAKRAKQSEEALNKLTDSGYDPNSFGESALNSLSKIHVPFLGDIESPRLRTDKRSEIDAIKQNFVSAVLRKESGAAISPAEYAAEEKKYFPQPGDSEAAKNFKAQARATAIAGLEAGSGRAGSALESRGPIAESSGSQSKFINGVEYVKVPGGWAKAGGSGNDEVKNVSYKK